MIIIQLDSEELSAVVQKAVSKALNENPKGESLHVEADQLLTVEQCAEFLKLTKPTIYGLIAKGEIPVMKRSKRCYFSKAELVQYLKAGRRKTLADSESEAKSYLGK